MSVFPADVEVLLVQHDAVDAVAVVPTDDPDTGQTPVALVSELRMTATGKVSKHELAEQAAAQASASR